MQLSSMRKEKVILSVIAILIGLLAAGGIFYLYQSAKIISPKDVKKISVSSPTPSPTSAVNLTITEPSDESVVDKKILTVSGKTVPNASILIINQINHVGAVADSQGHFSTTINLDSDQNLIKIIATSPTGEQAITQRVVTYSTQDF